MNQTANRPPARPGSGKPKGPALSSLLKPYRGLLVGLVVLSLFSNSISLLIPTIIARGIDSFTGNKLDVKVVIWEFFGAAVGVFLFTYVMSYIQTYASEKVARDLRTRLADRISRQNYTFLTKMNPSQL